MSLPCVFRANICFPPLGHEDAQYNFATYEPDIARQEQIKKFLEEQKETPLEQHYDAGNENRAKGAGFYAFSQDEEERRKQMEELLNTRKETMEVRKEMGAVDLKPGEVQGLKAEDVPESGGKPQSAAMVKRKKELEERRHMIQMKRRKVAGVTAESAVAESSSTTYSHSAAHSSASSSSSGPVPKSNNTGDPSAALEAAATPDPFAALEATSKQVDPLTALERKSSRPPRSRWDKRPAPDVDSFLADVEKDLVSGKRNV